MLSALQLHRKTIKFQKPDTTQGGITFKARCCLLFSVLNKILRVGTSGWFIVNRDSVHQICRPSPWRGASVFLHAILQNGFLPPARTKSCDLLDTVPHPAIRAHCMRPGELRQLSCVVAHFVRKAEDQKELRIPFYKPSSPANPFQPTLCPSIILHGKGWR